LPSILCQHRGRPHKPLIPCQQLSRHAPLDTLAFLTKVDGMDEIENVINLQGLF